MLEARNDNVCTQGGIVQIFVAIVIVGLNYVLFIYLAMMIALFQSSYRPTDPANTHLKTIPKNLTEQVVKMGV